MKVNSLLNKVGRKLNKIACKNSKKTNGNKQLFEFGLRI